MEEERRKYRNEMYRLKHNGCSGLSRVKAESGVSQGDDVVCQSSSWPRHTRRSVEHPVLAVALRRGTTFMVSNPRET